MWFEKIIFFIFVQFGSISASAYCGKYRSNTFEISTQGLLWYELKIKLCEMCQFTFVWKRIFKVCKSCLNEIMNMLKLLKGVTRLGKVLPEIYQWRQEGKQFHQFHQLSFFFFFRGVGVNKLVQKTTKHHLVIIFLDIFLLSLFGDMHSKLGHQHNALVISLFIVTRQHPT